MVRASFIVDLSGSHDLDWPLLEWATGWIGNKFGCYNSAYGGWHVIKLDCGLSVARMKSCKEAKELCKKLDD